MKNRKIKIIVGTPTGFCFGVKRAIAIVKREAKKAAGKNSVYTLGPIIHNNEVLNELKSLNVQIISDTKRLTKKPNASPIVIIRSHGCVPSIVQKIKQKGYQIVDATCPYVKRVQNYAAKLKKDGYFTIVIGDKNHPEVKGIMGYAGKQAKVYHLNSKFQIPNPKINCKRIGIIAQTTISRQEFQQAINSFNARDYQELRIFNTLCQESQNRQNTCQTVANCVDLIIVVGSRSSANTLSLSEIAKKSCQKVYQVENKSELKLKWFSRFNRNTQKVLRIGVIAGASTPQRTVFEVRERALALCMVRKILTGGHKNND